MTDAQLKAEILPRTRERRVCSPGQLDRRRPDADKDDNRDLYGRQISPKDILVERP
jgi:hypothetical protein